jgi:hypothetical protein
MLSTRVTVGLTLNTNLATSEHYRSQDISNLCRHLAANSQRGNATVSVVPQPSILEGTVWEGSQATAFAGGVSSSSSSSGVGESSDVTSAPQCAASLESADIECARDPFSINALLETARPPAISHESCMAPQPDLLQSTLHPFQRQAVAWMMAKEDGSFDAWQARKRMLNPAFTEFRIAQPGGRQLSLYESNIVAVANPHLQFGRR